MGGVMTKMDTGYLIGKRRFRVTIEIEAELRDQAQANLDLVEQGQGIPNMAAPWEKVAYLDYMQRQKRLFEAIRQKPGIVAQYFRKTVETELLRYIAGIFECDHPYQDEKRYAEILALALEKLSCEDQAWIQDIMTGEFFREDADMVCAESFKAQVLCHSIEEVE